MALVVEDGTGLSNAESYISVANAIIYITAYKGANTAWDSSTEAAKEVAARVATQYLDGRYSWRGTKSTSDQALGLPVSGGVDDDGYAIDGIRTGVANACAEAMFLSVTGTDLSVIETSKSDIKQKTTGALTTIFKDNSRVQPAFPVISRLLTGLIESGSKVYRG